MRERAVRMYGAAEPKPVIRRLAEEFGVHHEVLRGWIRQADADTDERDVLLTSDERAELSALRKENARLERANEVLRTASVFRGTARPDPTRTGRRRSSTSTRGFVDLHVDTLRFQHR
ncbi:transposase [Streptomyces hirsutus]|nr:transposase [Streptomyces hirsutus]